MSVIRTEPGGASGEGNRGAGLRGQDIVLGTRKLYRPHSDRCFIFRLIYLRWNPHLPARFANPGPTPRAKPSLGPSPLLIRQKLAVHRHHHAVALRILLLVDFQGEVD